MILAVGGWTRTRSLSPASRRWTLAKVPTSSARWWTSCAWYAVSVVVANGSEPALREGLLLTASTQRPAIPYGRAHCNKLCMQPEMHYCILHKNTATVRASGRCATRPVGARRYAETWEIPDPSPARLYDMHKQRHVGKACKHGMAHSCVLHVSLHQGFGGVLMEPGRSQKPPAAPSRAAV